MNLERSDDDTLATIESEPYVRLHWGHSRRFARGEAELDMLGRPVQANLEEVGFVPGGRDAGQGADLGVAELAPGHGLGEQGELGKGAGGADLLAGGVGVDAARPEERGGSIVCTGSIQFPRNDEYLRLESRQEREAVGRAGTQL